MGSREESTDKANRDDGLSMTQTIPNIKSLIGNVISSHTES